MSINRKCVKITADGLMSEVVNHYEDEDWKNMGRRGREGHSELPIAQMLGYRLSIFMYDYFESTDPVNKQASFIRWSLMGCRPDMMLKGPVFFFNEDKTGTVDFTLHDLNELRQKACI